jgi:hypothetical protein
LVSIWAGGSSPAGSGVCRSPASRGGRRHVVADRDHLRELAVYYRAPIPESPRSHFLKTAPEIHRIFFEFKEFGALFTLPLTVVAAFILWKYGPQVLDRPWLRYTVAVLMGLAFFYLVVAFGLGAAVSKLRPA